MSSDITIKENKVQEASDADSDDEAVPQTPRRIRITGPPVDQRTWQVDVKYAFRPLIVLFLADWS
jgi:hypothetical protein